MENHKAHNYKGQLILPCTYDDSRRQGYHWYLVTTHHTGMMYGEQDSPRYRTLAEARQDIDYRLEMRG